MEIFFTILVLITCAILGATPFVVVNEIKKASLKDKNYKLFRIKLKQEKLKQELTALEKEIKDFEESVVSAKSDEESDK